MCVDCECHINGGRGCDGGSDVLMSCDDEGQLIGTLLLVEVLRQHDGVDFWGNRQELKNSLCEIHSLAGLVSLCPKVLFYRL
jgi:hypothetical protein